MGLRLPLGSRTAIDIARRLLRRLRRAKGETPFAWHKPDNMPRTKHGKWEHDQVKAALEK